MRVQLVIEIGTDDHDLARSVLLAARGVLAARVSLGQAWLAGPAGFDEEDAIADELSHLQPLLHHLDWVIEKWDL